MGVQVGLWRGEGADEQAKGGGGGYQQSSASSQASPRAKAFQTPTQCDTSTSGEHLPPPPPQERACEPDRQGEPTPDMTRHLARAAAPTHSPRSRLLSAIVSPPPSPTAQITSDDPDRGQTQRAIRNELHSKAKPCDSNPPPTHPEEIGPLCQPIVLGRSAGKTGPKRQRLPHSTSVQPHSSHLRSLAPSPFPSLPSCPIPPPRMSSSPGAPTTPAVAVAAAAPAVCPPP